MKQHARVQRLIESLRGKQRVLVLTHDNPDPDAIAAGMALCGLIDRQLGGTATLAFGGIIGRAENKALVDTLAVDMRPISDLNVEDFDTVALVDAQPGSGNNSLPPDMVPTVVIDHHPRQPATRRAAFSDVRPQVGACSTILTAYYRALGLPIDVRLATALFYGIKVDTQDLGRHASPADVEAYRHLFPLADKLLLPRISYPPLPREYFETFHAALESARIVDQVIISALDEVENPNAVAEVADLLLRLEGMVWSICLGFFADQLFVSLRTADPEANAHDVVRAAIGSAGSGGGHGRLAGGRIALGQPNHNERLRVRDDLVVRLLGVLGIGEKVGEPLLRGKARRTVS